MHKIAGGGGLLVSPESVVHMELKRFIYSELSSFANTCDDEKCAKVMRLSDQ